LKPQRKCFTRLASSRDLLGPTRRDHQSDADAKARQHVDQCIGAEQIDATAQEVARFVGLETSRQVAFID
jgi:hypothetical protein